MRIGASRNLFIEFINEVWSLTQLPIERTQKVFIKDLKSAIIDKPEIKTERVIFENITQDDITSNTKNSSGYGGPTQIDMNTWREMICSKSCDTHSKMLADEIATLAKRLATDTIPHDYISTLLACRLVPLKKKK